MIAVTESLVAANFVTIHIVDHSTMTFIVACVERIKLIKTLAISSLN